MPTKSCHESKDLKQVTDSSTYLKSMLVQGMADENAVNESWGCISQEEHNGEHVESYLQKMGGHRLCER